MLLQADFAQAMQGIVCDTDARVRDEAPQAYKDLAKVMANQASLTDIVHRQARTLLCDVGFGKTSAVHVKHKEAGCNVMHCKRAGAEQLTMAATRCLLLRACDGW